MPDDAPPSGLPTIEAVAAAAGVSKTTVSHVLSGNRPVSAATRERVQRVIADLGYRPSAVARSLKNARSHTIAVVVPDVTNPFYPALARGLQSAIVGAGYLSLLADTHGDVEAERAFVADVVQRRVDGLVVSASGLRAEDLLEAQRAGIALVGIGPALAGLRIDSVSADDERAAADAVAHLRERGHTRIGTVAGPEDSDVARGRLEGYRAALAEVDAPADDALVARGDFTREGGRGAMAELLAHDPPPTAVLCANDLMAVGALDAARAAGVDVPGDVAVVGIDDIDAAAMVTPALTTVRIPAREIGWAAGELLLARMAGAAPAAAQRISVAHELVVRAST